MRKSDEVVAQRKAILDKAEALRKQVEDVEDRNFTEEETAKLQEWAAEAEELVADIEALREQEQKAAEALARLDEQSEWSDKPQGSTRIITRREAEFSSFGEYIRQVKDSANNAGVRNELVHRLEASAPGMQTVIDSDGGFLIPPQFAQTIHEKMADEGVILGLPMERIPLTGNTFKLPYVDDTTRASGSIAGGVIGYWVEETGTLSDTKPKLGQMSLRLKKCAGVGYLTEEMQEDYGASGAFLERQLARALIYQVEDAIVNGDGSGKPLGILNAACKVSVTKETNQTAATIWGPNVVKMWARMPQTSRNNAVWLVNQDCEPQLWSLTLEGRYGSAAAAAGAIPLYYPAGTITNQGSYGMIMGRPVIPVQYCKTLGTEGDIILWDPTEYVLAEKAGGVKTASSMHVRFLTDETTLRVTYRVDGQPAWSSALTPANGTNTLSPIITLAVR